MAAVEVCELCGAAITEGDARYGMVPDPAARYPGRPEWDGGRLVVAYSPEHMIELNRRAEGRAGRPSGDGD